MLMPDINGRPKILSSTCKTVHIHMERVLQDDVLQSIWRLLDAAANKRTAFTLMQLATVAENNTPKLRTIVVRDFHQEEGIVVFTADIRSWIALTALDSDKGLQLRMEGQAEVVGDLEKRKEAWGRLRIHSHLLFQSPLEPGTRLSSPLEAMPVPGRVSEAGEPVGSFALVHITLDRMDWLNVSGEPHMRCIFTRANGCWHGDWIAP